MYRLDDKQAAIREIKKYLYVISTRVYPQIERGTIDGQYDEATRMAVKKFQRIKRLKESGEVDIDTFNALYDVYRSATDDFYARDYIIGSTPLPVGIGCNSDDVRVLHVMINELAREHPDVKDVGNGSYYSPRTAASVMALRRVYGLDEKESIDKELYTMMRLELEAIRRREKNPEEMI